ncbi:MAG: pyridoxamine 5'-phosphate oxidase family protein [Actinomycetota bacterium]|nr:pyridoxamine 5'-phosphate oxidase family protein [Actinomycetota bacterium]
MGTRGRADGGGAQLLGVDHAAVRPAARNAGLGVWVEGTLYFGTSRGSRKGRNLATNPALTVHLESGDDVVIIEGMVEEVTDRALLATVDAAYQAKYGIASVKPATKWFGICSGPKRRTPG